MTALLSPDDLKVALELRDLSDPAGGPHAMQLLLEDVLTALTDAWGCTLDLQRRRPLVSVADNYDRLGYATEDVTRDTRYSRYAAETVMLRSHTSAGIPPALRALAASTHRSTAEVDVLLARPGLCTPSGSTPATRSSGSSPASKTCVYCRRTRRASTSPTSTRPTAPPADGCTTRPPSATASPCRTGRRS